MTRPRMTAQRREHLHDIIEWLDTDIEAALHSRMPTEAEAAMYRSWIDATVEAHVLLSGCTGHSRRNPDPDL